MEFIDRDFQCGHVRDERCRIEADLKPESGRSEVLTGARQFLHLPVNLLCEFLLVFVCECLLVGHSHPKSLFTRAKRLLKTVSGK